MDYVQLANAAASVTDVAQVAAAQEPPPAWLGGLMGMAVVMVALTACWLASSIVGQYFIKNAPKKTDAASKAPVASTAAAPVASQAAVGLPIAVILAAAAQLVNQPMRSVVISAPAHSNANWAIQGRETIFASHTAKSPRDVSGLSAVKKG
ncbi:MAG: OadG family transporter subunit [Rhodospirillaceae bacterium]